jgi:myo-inositol-1(or 4)-monophosphatase
VTLPAAAESVAVAACLTGGRYLRRVFETGGSEAVHSATDAKSSADVAAEARILDVLRGAYPDHAVDAEESGHHGGDGRHRWVVDPLDGTNDFEAGLPTFATAVTLLVDGEAELAAVHAPVPDDRYVCRRGELRHDGDPVDGDETPPVDPEAATVMSVIGHDVKRDPEASAVSAALNRGVEAACKRRLESWSPALHWGLLARGRLDGAVAYRPDDEEQLLGELFVEAVGHETARDADGEWFAAARTEALLAELAATLEDATGSSRR